MFPIRDHNPSERTPYVTYALIAINIGVFILMWPIMDNNLLLNRFYTQWGLIPAIWKDAPETLVTSMFLHGGFTHLAGNMLFLWVFGDNMEDEMGHLPFLAFYLAGGLAAAALQIAAAPWSFVPMVGASGAIAALLGGYLLLFPKARVDVLVFLVIFIRILPVPAGFVLLVWFALQLLGGFGNSADEGGVAYWAHTGGFVAGLILTFPLWLRLGGISFWTRTHGHPPHPETQYAWQKSRVPPIRRRR